MTCHYRDAERFLQSPWMNQDGTADYTPALAHAILALIDRLEDPVLTFSIGSAGDDDE